MRLAARRRPDLLGKLERSSRLPNRNGGGVILLREREKGEGRGCADLKIKKLCKTVPSVPD